MRSMKILLASGVALAAVVAVKFAPAKSIAATPAESVSWEVMTPAPALQTKPATTSAAALKLVVAPSGNEVRYRIREQLVKLPLPNDAIGKTAAVSGGITLDKDGKIVPAESKFVVDVSTLTSDREMRDNYVRRRILETDQYSTVEFTPTAIIGLPKTLPTSGTHTFDVAGNLTVHGVTKPVTWKVTAKAAGSSVTGSASTAFNFADFNLSQPRVPVLISVQDTIKLEYDFSLVTGSR
ncbi:MAG TPA: YceI family protein [Gemmatimonadaceae bacterium]|jgi:polyisoprenoid-binding protein YceI